MMNTEQKWDDSDRVGVSSKDDFKQQQFEARTGLKERPQWSEPATGSIEQLVVSQQQPDFLTSAPIASSSAVPVMGIQQPLVEKLQLGLEEGTNASLAQRITPSDLKAEKQLLHHVQTPQEEPAVVVMHRKDTSVPHSPPTVQRTEPISRGSSGDPLPSQMELPSQIGESAGAGWEQIKHDIMERAEPQIAKAKEMVSEVRQATYHLWKGEENRRMGVDASEDSMSAKAKLVFNDLSGKAESLKDQATTVVEEQIRPRVEETFGLNKRKDSIGGEAKSGIRRRREYTTRKPMAVETLSHRLNRYRLKALDVWRGEEPVIRSYFQQAARWIRANKLEVPAIALGTLLTLWLSMSLIGWMAFPNRAQHEQMVVYHAPQQTAFSSGPSQDVPGPGLVDKMKINIAGEIDSLKDKTTDRLSHIKDAMPAMPTMDDIKLKVTDRLGHLKPSSAGVSSGNGLKDAAVEGIDRLKESMPSMPAMPAVPSMGAIKQSLSEGVSDIKERISGFQDDKDAPPHQHTHFAGESKTSEGFIPDDANAPPHKHIEPKQTSAAAGIITDDINAPPHQHIEPQQQQPITVQQQAPVQHLSVEQQQAEQQRIHQQWHQEQARLQQEALMRQQQMPQQSAPVHLTQAQFQQWQQAGVQMPPNVHIIPEPQQAQPMPQQQQPIHTPGTVV